MNIKSTGTLFRRHTADVMRNLLLLASCVVSVLSGPKGKPGEAPTQPPIASGCITVEYIYSHSKPWTPLFSDFGAMDEKWSGSGLSPSTRLAPGLSARIVSACDSTAAVRITVSFFKANGEKLEARSQVETVPAGKRRAFFIHRDEVSPKGMVSRIDAVSIELRP